MGSVQNFFTSRDNNTDPATYVGQLDRLWYNPDTNQIFVSDGSTPGGRPVDLGANANALINTLTVSNIVATSGNIAVTGNLAITGNISPATSTRVGGIRPGPGIEISDTGLLTIDSAGLPISFGDFFANVNQLSMVNANEDMYLVSNGTGNINLIGGVGFFKPNGFPPSAEPFFRAKSDGQLRILVPVEDPIEGGVEIIGSATGNYIAPGQPGTMLQMTGNPGVPVRMYMDGNAEYAALVARRFNGNVAVPTQVLAGEYVFRINATAATDAGMPNVAMAQIQFQALENQTTTAQGSTINLVVTPIGSTASSRVEVANVTVANGVTATKFTTAGTVVATGNITGGNLTTAGITSTGSLTASTTISATGNITGGNVAATNYTGLVTHGIRNAGVVSGTTLTLNVTTDDIVKCTFADNFTVAFSNIIAGRVITLIATNTSAGDTDIITAGISAVNTQGDSTLTVTQQTTAVITYYSLDGDVGNIYASAVYG